jgi:hypothetical protein
MECQARASPLYVGQGAVQAYYGVVLFNPTIIMDKVTPFHDIEGLGWQIQRIVFLKNSCSTDILVTFMSV